MRVKLIPYCNQEIRMVGRYKTNKQFATKKGLRKAALVVDVFSEYGEYLCDHLLISNMSAMSAVRYPSVIEFSATVRRYLKGMTKKQYDWGVYFVRDVKVLPNEILDLLKKGMNDNA